MTKTSSPVKLHIGGIFVVVNEMPRAVKWYREILGLPEDASFMRSATPDMQTIYSIPLGKTNLILDSMHRDNLTPSPNHLFMLDTDNINQTYEFVKALGVHVLTNIQDVGDVKFFEVLDSEGNKLMFCEETEKE
ncbi:Glyoxalase-like domain protein [Bacillus sp. THAF10]|uniref:VOC family protein n=1 Tax=Bacillus sp. THAF10 TaxID=2587848 RepID=UPI001269517C|nr:VOC family protein [Bacillus sp. THAF10]QFT87922.1 Glyoxalase-like domain protein [Bacillus sp. THAF10]